MRLRLHHHTDGARVAYREHGTGPPLVLLHSVGLTYREWEPVIQPLGERFRVILPDLPLHGDSEDRPRHPYTREWLTEVMARFCLEVGGPRALLVGHDLGAELLLAALADGSLSARRVVLASNRLHHA
ncbi:MAG: alpha/beta fold hydrolase, partial [Solirubrobacterales bacterium]|nr:alpha/beta fold hydrolase [Solirubrobacterales bacterium]